MTTEPRDPVGQDDCTISDPVRVFVEHWGMMARTWGINPTMGELFALLYITGTDWTAEALRGRLKISRGNVSMNLRELLAWGVVHKVHRQGERREYYRAETDVWTLFRRILKERKRRELDPTLFVLRETSRRIRDDAGLESLHDRVSNLERFFLMIDELAGRLTAIRPEELEVLLRLVRPGDGIDAGSPSTAGRNPENPPGHSRREV